MRLELEAGAVKLNPHQVLRLRDSAGSTDDCPTRTAVRLGRPSSSKFSSSRSVSSAPVSASSCASSITSTVCFPWRVFSARKRSMRRTA